MKKIIAVVLCVVLALACVGMTSCGDAADKQSVDAIKKQVNLLCIQTLNSLLLNIWMVLK